MREVLATPGELLSVAAGRRLSVRTSCGEEMVLRIPTATEYQQHNGPIDPLFARAVVRPLPPTLGTQ